MQQLTIYWKKTRLWSHHTETHRASHLLNPCLLEFHNVRMLDSSNKSHLQNPISNNNDQNSNLHKNKKQIPGIWSKSTSRDYKNTKLTSWWADLLHLSVCLASLIFFNTYLHNPIENKSLQSSKNFYVLNLPINKDNLINHNAEKMVIITSSSQPCDEQG